MFAASDPHAGSVIAKAAIASPLATLGSQARFCSTVPNGERAMVSERFANDGEAAHVGPVFGVGDAQLEEASGAKLAHQRPALTVDVVRITVREIVGAPALQFIREFAVLGPEERPGEE